MLDLSDILDGVTQANHGVFLFIEENASGDAEVYVDQIGAGATNADTLLAVLTDVIVGDIVNVLVDGTNVDVIVV